MDVVVEKDLPLEVYFHTHHHNGEIALFGREAYRRKILRLTQIKEFHDDSVVDMPHLVDIIEAQLYMCLMHIVFY